MIALGPIELERVPAKAGDEGWSEHWQVFHRRGRTRKLIGHAVSPAGAARIAVQAGLHEVQTGQAARGLVALDELVQRVAELLRATGLPDPARGVQPSQETTSSRIRPGGQE